MIRAIMFKPGSGRFIKIALIALNVPVVGNGLRGGPGRHLFSSFVMNPLRGMWGVDPEVQCDVKPWSRTRRW
jgi:hypothetical protein